jgi:translocation and assembly module TamA
MERPNRGRSPFSRRRAVAECHAARAFRAGPAPRLAIGLLLAALASGCTSGPLKPGLAPQSDQGAAEEGQLAVPYEVAIQGVDDTELRSLLEQVSETKQLVDRPPPSLIRLRQRAEADRPRLEEALRSRGYYDAQISVAVDSHAKPVRVLFGVDPGPLYRFGKVAIEVVPPVQRPELPSLKELKIAPGEPAVSQTILDAESTLLARARAQGHALAELGQRQAVVDHDTKTMDLTLVLRPGPVVRFGEIRIEGLKTVEEDAVRRRLPWKPGEEITSQRVEDGRTALFDSALFSSVVINLGTTPDAENRLPVTVKLNESKHRSIAVGAGYRTDEGLGGNVSWEDRNAFGRGERVRIALDGSFIGAHLNGTFRKPDFWKRDQALIAGSELAYDNTDAYKSRSASANIGLERQLAKGMTIAAGPAFRASNVKESSGDQDVFALLSLPVLWKWDRSNNLLNPSKGGRLMVQNEPFVDVSGNDVAFNKSELSYTHYLKVLDQPGVVLAGRTALGTLFGASRKEVPADLRFYAGGGGSVRGFAYQSAGELDKDHKPIGGRSLLELSGEVRVRLTETIGAVAFVDAGSDFTSTVPDLSQTLRIGAGPGLRYFSPIGPLRLDIGIPVNPRPSDDAFQVYVSLGQAF